MISHRARVCFLSACRRNAVMGLHDAPVWVHVPHAHTDRRTLVFFKFVRLAAAAAAAERRFCTAACIDFSALLLGRSRPPFLSGRRHSK